MAFAMVYGMEVYNAVLRSGHLDASSFVIPAGEMVFLAAVVTLLQRLIASPLAKKTASAIMPPEKNPGLFPFVRSACMVLCMCPMMSFVAVIMFQESDGIGLKWIWTFLYNFPMAFFWQIAVAGPLVRTVFRTVFRHQTA